MHSPPPDDQLVTCLKRKRAATQGLGGGGHQSPSPGAGEIADVDGGMRVGHRDGPAAHDDGDGAGAVAVHELRADEGTRHRGGEGRGNMDPREK